MRKSDKLSSINRVFFSVVLGICSLFIVNCDNHMVRYLLPTLPEPPDFIVTFVSNSGGTIPKQSVIRGGRVSKPNDPIMDGFTFAGWYTDNGTFNNEWRFSYAVMEDTTLYGKWTKDEVIPPPPPPVNFTVSFESNGGTAVLQQTVAEGGKADAPPPPSKTGFTGYALEGWYTDPGLTLTSKWDFARDAVSGDITLYAKWTIDMVRVDGGSFEMGSPILGNINERPAHTVTLTTGFYMSTYEVTQVQWEEVMETTIDQLQAGADGTLYSGTGPNHPVYYVSWYNALVFCNKLSIQEGLTPAYRINGFTIPAAWGPLPTDPTSTWNAVTIDSGSTGYRLPTEAQWEYAARGRGGRGGGAGGGGGGGGSPGNYTFAGSDTFDDVAWLNMNSGIISHPVGMKAPNGLGLYDMSGNAWEWCWDWYGGYSSEAQTDPTGALSGATRVYRGGSHYYGDGRCTYRDGHEPHRRFRDSGIRLVRPL